MNFRVGQKVVCVNDSPDSWWGTCEVRRGCVYTVRGIDLDAEQLGIYLEEIIVPPVEPWPDWEPSFTATRFRPVKETNIDIFTAMLSPTPKQKTKENA